MNTIDKCAIKSGHSFLYNAESTFKDWAIPHLPQWLTTWHLTLMTLMWSILVVLFAYLAQYSIHWLWGTSLAIIGQYVTDLLDGELGRRRDTGLIKWGFYMDHFLDYIFTCALTFGGYLICPADLTGWYFAILVILGGFMVNSFLLFGATNKFEISRNGIGPSEFRIALIAFNTLVIISEHAGFEIILPIITFGLTAGLIWHTYTIQKRLWKLDMVEKRKQERREVL